LRFAEKKIGEKKKKMDTHSGPNWATATDGTRLIADDQYLIPYADVMRRRLRAWEPVFCFFPFFFFSFNLVFLLLTRA
jgi:hypothetical protein